jgi:DNA modification methylase
VIRILNGDCREVMRTLPENSVDAIVTDPPYHLTNGGGGPHGKSRETPFARARAGATSTGFMGMTWDGGDVAFQAETWAEALRVLKPGGHLLAFGGTRTYHRLVCAIEDAGFVVRDMAAWLYGAGFPKATDKAKIPAAWRGWNTALKPAIEPISLARKPMIGTLAENLQRWGTGGSAARFFWSPKASRADRNEGLQGMPEVMPPTAVDRPGQAERGTGRGSRSGPRANHHPTVKPTDLMRYLCRLVTPKGGVVLDPFMGSGSTLKAAELEGFSAIGIELDPQYIEIARRRIAADMPLFAEVAA